MRATIQNHNQQASGFFARVRAGFVLLEVILAMSILSIIAVSLTVALDRIGDVALASQREMSIMRNLQSLMTEALRNPLIEPLEDSWGPDRFGVVYETLIEEFEITNDEEAILPEMFRIVIQANWVEGRTPRNEVVETYRYARLYQTNAR